MSMYEVEAADKILNYFKCCRRDELETVTDVFEITDWGDGGRFLVTFDSFIERVYDVFGVNIEQEDIQNIVLVDD